MTLSINTETGSIHLATVAPIAQNQSVAENQKQRILVALGVNGGGIPSVDDVTLRRYYTYLAANLAWPFAACYPEPTTVRERDQFRCTVLELLDPDRHMGDEFDGLFCKTRKGGFEVNLPLVELQIAADSANFALIDDYCYWFANWR